MYLLISFCFVFPFSFCRIVSTYLVHHGFCSTAEAFARSAGQSFEEEITSIKNRQSKLWIHWDSFSLFSSNIFFYFNFLRMLLIVLDIKAIFYSLSVDIKLLLFKFCCIQMCCGLIVHTLFIRMLDHLQWFAKNVFFIKIHVCLFDNMIAYFFCFCFKV